MPRAPGDAVGYVRVDVSWEPLGGALWVVDREGDRFIRDLSDVPFPVRPVVRAAVQRILAIVLLQLVGLAVERELGVADAVRVPAGNSIVDRVSRVRGYGGLALGELGGG